MCLIGLPTLVLQFMIITLLVGPHQVEGCMRDDALVNATGRRCGLLCTTDEYCKRNRQCVCDGICGLSCIATAKVPYCFEIPENPNVSLAYEYPGRTFDSIVTAACIEGSHYVSGNSTRKCQGDGSWTGDPYNCTILDGCLQPTHVVENAALDPTYFRDRYEIGYWYYYSCDYGHYRDGVHAIRCMETGEWSVPEFICRPKTCPPPRVPNGYVEGSYNFGDRIEIKCNTGYELDGLPYRTCQGDQTWSGYEATCNKVKCPVLNAPANGDIIGTKFEYGEAVRYVCDRGYAPEPEGTRRCQADKTWSGSAEETICREALVIQCPHVEESILQHGQPNIAVSWTEPTYTDNSGNRGGMNSTHTSPTVFGIGVHHVIYFAWDLLGNTASCNITIRVTDREKPTMLCPNLKEQLTEIGKPYTEVSWPEPKYTDNSGNRGGMNSSHTSPSVFDIGVHNVTYFAWDPSGNTARCNITIQVSDKEKPTIHCIRVEEQVVATDRSNITVYWTKPEYTDNDNNRGGINSTHTSPSVFDIGVHNVTYVAWDPSGNTASCNITIIVTDQEKPSVVCPIDIIEQVLVTGKRNIIVSWTEPTFSDNSGRISATNSTRVSPSVFDIGVHDVTYFAWDPSGNMASCTVTIRVVDRETPTILCPNIDEQITEIGRSIKEVSWSEPTYTDNSGSRGGMNSTHTSPSVFNIGVHNVTYFAWDPSGNTASCNITIRVTDTEKPTIHCVNVEEQFVVTDQHSITVSWDKPDYTDNDDNRGGMNSSHTSPSVFGIGVHNVTYFAWDPSDNTASCNITIRVIAACPENATEVELSSQHTETLSWLLTPANNHIAVDSYERCDVATKNRGQGLATRVCQQDKDRGAIWLEPVYRGCGKDEDFALADLPETPVIASNVENVAEALNNVTQQQQSADDQELTAEDVKDIAETFRNIVDVESEEPEVTKTVIEIVNNVVDLTDVAADDKHQAEATQLTESSREHLTDILLAIEQQVNRSTASGQNLTAVEPNIAVTITTVRPNQQSGFSFAVVKSDSEEFQEEDIHTSHDDKEISNEVRTAVTLPPVIFNTSGNGTIGVSFLVHNSDILFLTNSSNQTVGSDIVSAIVTGVDRINNLPEPVILEFTVSGENAECVFWDFEILDWSTGGCELNELTDGQAICHCDHLTNFAVLVDVTFEKGHIVLDIVSKIGCGVSMLALFITFSIFIGFRRLRIGANAIPRQILIHLCVALFLLYTVFLVGIDQVSHRNGCICVAFLLQYLTLTSLMWMAVEGFNLYLMVVRVFDAMPERFVFKAAVVAYGLPFLVTVISIGTGFSYYGHFEYCFVGTGPPLFYGVVLPIGCILLFNFSMFLKVSHTLCKANLGGTIKGKSKSKINIQRLQNAFAMSILMGLTWIFGFFAIAGAKFIFSLLFCLCNSFQGLVLFLVFCVRQEDVRKTVRSYMHTICSGLATRYPRSETASTVVNNSSTTKSPYSEMDFSASQTQSPYKDMDFSAAVTMTQQSSDKDKDFSAAVPMTHLPTDNLPQVCKGTTMITEHDVSIVLHEDKSPLTSTLASIAGNGNTEPQIDEECEDQETVMVTSHDPPSQDCTPIVFQDDTKFKAMEGCEPQTLIKKDKDEGESSNQENGEQNSKLDEGDHNQELDQKNQILLGNIDAVSAAQTNSGSNGNMNNDLENDATKNPIG